MKVVHFITGGTGFVGRHLVSKLLDEGEAVCLLVRPQSIDRVATLFNANFIQKKQLTIVSGDIVKSNLGLSKSDLQFLATKKLIIWHLAANLSFYRREEKEVWRTNYSGTKSVISFANTYGTQFFYLSTALVCGSNTSHSEAQLLKPQYFHNAYEASKWQAELAVRQMVKIPYWIFRPTIILGSAYISKATACTFGYYRFCYMAFIFHNWLKDQLNENNAWLRLLGTTYNPKSKIITAPWLSIPYPSSNGTEFVMIDSVINSLWHTYSHSKKIPANICLHLTANPVALGLAFRQLLSDMSIQQASFFPIPTFLFTALLKILTLVPGKIGKYSKSARKYQPYLTLNYNFDTTNRDTYLPKLIKEVTPAELHKVNIFAKKLFTPVTFRGF